MQSESSCPVSNGEVDRSASAADAVSESRTGTDAVTVDSELAAATAAKVRCLLSRKKVMSTNFR